MNEYWTIFSKSKKMKASDFKFKVWDEEEAKFVRSKDIENIEQIPTTPTRVGFKLKTRFELFQSTGLKDSKGHEIYDGDVLHVLAGKRELKDSQYIVYYKEGSFLINEGANEMGEPSILLLSFALKMWKAKKLKVIVAGHKKTT